MLLKKGFKAPNFRLPTVGGAYRTLGHFMGRPAIYCGWGSWDPSRKALPVVQEFHRKNHLDAQIVTIAFDAQGVGPAMRYLLPAKTSCEMVVDANCLLSRAWGAKRLPFVVAVDARGYVQHIGDRLDRKTLDAALKAVKKKPMRKGDLKVKRQNGPPKVDLLVQGCNIYLSRGRTAEAADSLRKALALDPGNDIIRGQIVALEDPAKVYGR